MWFCLVRFGVCGLCLHLCLGGGAFHLFLWCRGAFFSLSLCCSSDVLVFFSVIFVFLLFPEFFSSSCDVVSFSFCSFFHSFSIFLLFSFSFHWLWHHHALSGWCCTLRPSFGVVLLFPSPFQWWCSLHSTFWSGGSIHTFIFGWWCLLPPF